MAASDSNHAHSPVDVTAILRSLRTDGREGWDQLASAVYDQLRAIAHNRLRAEGTAGRLDTTELVHEAYLKLVDQTRVDWNDRGHFFAVATMVMRRILINQAERRTARKRGGDASVVPLEESGVSVMPAELAHEILALDEALEGLRELDERQAQVVDCRYFGGLSIEETAEALHISPATVKRDWAAARAWLYDRLRTRPRD